MNQLIKLISLTALLLLSDIAIAKKSPWSVGVVTSYSPVIYSDTGSKTVVMPVIGYEGKHLFLRGLTAGVRLYPIGSSNNLIFKLQFDPRTLQPENLITFKYSNLMSEKSSVLGGISYQMNTALGLFEIGVNTDLGNQHNGLYLEGVWRLPIRVNHWIIAPEVGYSYNSDRINDYLYPCYLKMQVSELGLDTSTRHDF